MMRLRAVLLLLALPLACPAAQVTLSSSASTVTIGERIELRVVVRAGAGISSIRVQVPPGAYEVVARRSLPALRTADGLTFEETVTIAFFQTGDFTVGPFQVELLPLQQGQSSEATGQLAIHVRSLLGENDRDIKPLKELLAMRGDPRHLLPFAAALLLLLLAALAVRLRQRAKRKHAAAIAPVVPPELELEARRR